MKIEIEYHPSEGKPEDPNDRKGWYVWADGEAPVGPFTTKRLAQRFIKYIQTGR